MSSDYEYFEEDTFNDAVLEQLDAIEAAATTSFLAPTTSHVYPQRSISKEDSFCDLTLGLEEEDLSQLDKIVEQAYRGNTTPGPSRIRTETVQMTLHGGPALVHKPIQRMKSAPRPPSSVANNKTKVWDQTTFAQSGPKQPKGKGPVDSEEDSEPEGVEFVQFPAPFISSKSMKLKKVLPLISCSRVSCDALCMLFQWNSDALASVT